MDNVRGVIAVAAVLLVLSGCGAGHSSATPTASAPLGRDDQKSAYLQFAQCMRQNGQPNFPDPVQDANGDWGFPASVGKPVAPAPCDAAYRQLRAVNQNLAEQGSRVDMTKLRDFAKCMREHGLSDWPDPNADGLFPLPGRYAPPNGNQLIDAPLRSCPHDGINIQLPRYDNRK